MRAEFKLGLMCEHDNDRATKDRKAIGCLAYTAKLFLLSIFLVCAITPFFFVHVTFDYEGINRALDSFHMLPSTQAPAPAENNTVTRKSRTKRPMKVAYAWLLGGVHPDRHGYKGFLYTIMISMRVLRRVKSVADFVVYVQLSPDNPSATFTEEEERWLREIGARIIYLDKPTRESFAAVVYEKFRPLQLTEYERVIFLDADMMPFRNLDYLMEASLDGVIGPNFIMATRGEPCNAAFFMLQPEEGAWDELQGIIKRQFEEAKDLPYPHFDRFAGWGHNFTKMRDNWEAIKFRGRRWNWHAVHSDQGLLYQWVKYHKMNTTIFIGEKVQTWVPGRRSLPKLYSQGQNTLDEYAEPRQNCDAGNWRCAVPYRDWKHFAGVSKPWSHKKITEKDQFGRKQYHIEWVEELKLMNSELKMGVPVDDWVSLYEQMKDPPLGHLALWADHAHHVGKMDEKELEEHLKVINPFA